MSIPPDEQLREALKDVIDPELGYNIVDLGLVYDVHAEDSDITVTMTLTTPGCPASEYIQDGVTDCLSMIEGVSSVTVNLVWDPPWGPDAMSPDAQDFFGISV